MRPYLILLLTAVVILATGCSSQLEVDSYSKRNDRYKKRVNKRMMKKKGYYNTKRGKKSMGNVLVNY